MQNWIRKKKGEYCFAKYRNLKKEKRKKKHKLAGAHKSILPRSWKIPNKSFFPKAPALSDQSDHDSAPYLGRYITSNFEQNEEKNKKIEMVSHAGPTCSFYINIHPSVHHNRIHVSKTIPYHTIPYQTMPYHSAFMVSPHACQTILHQMYIIIMLMVILHRDPQGVLLFCFVFFFSSSFAAFENSRPFLKVRAKGNSVIEPRALLIEYIFILSVFLF